MIKANISNLAGKLAEIRAHHMCVTLTDDGVRFLMTVPPGFSIDAVRCDYSLHGKAWAIDRMITIADKYWSHK